LGDLDLDDEFGEGKRLDVATKGLGKAFEKGRGKSPLSLLLLLSFLKLRY